MWFCCSFFLLVELLGIGCACICLYAVLWGFSRTKCKVGWKRAVDSVRLTVVEIRSLQIGSLLSEALLLLLLVSPMHNLTNVEHRDWCNASQQTFPLVLSIGFLLGDHFERKSASENNFSAEKPRFYANNNPCIIETQGDSEHIYNIYMY